MATILAYTSPARGHLFPLVPTLLTLRDRGHRVHVRTLAGDVPRLLAAGLEASPMAPAIEGRTLDDWKARSPLDAMDRAFTTWLDRAEHEIPDLRGALDEVSADVVLADVNSWGALAAAEASGRPFAVFAPYFLNIDVPGRPPFGLGLAPMRGWLGHARDRVLWMLLRFAGRRYLRRLNALRGELGLSDLPAIDALTSPAHRVLAYTAEPLEFSHGWPENVHLVGPGAWEPAETERLPLGERPIVLVTCSTEFQDDGRLVETAFAALAGEDVDVVATTGAVDPASLVAPPNARAVRFAAHGPLLQRAVAVVCHGGMGITQKALAAGVPVCVVPWGRDQHDVARHVELCGAGTSVPRAKLSADRLRGAVRAAVDLRPAARRVSAALAAAGGPARAADVIEGLLAGRSSG